MSSILALSDFPRRDQQQKGLPRSSGPATVTCIGTGLTHEYESTQRIEKVRRIIEYLDTHAKHGPEWVTSARVSKMNDFLWEQLAEQMGEHRLIGRTTQQQVIATLREREALAS